MQMAPSSVIHVAPTKTLEYEVRDKKIRAMDEVGFGSFIQAIVTPMILSNYLCRLARISGRKN